MASIKSISKHTVFSENNICIMFNFTKYDFLFLERAYKNTILWITLYFLHANSPNNDSKQ